MTALCRWSSAFEGHRNARDEHDRLRDISRGQSMRWGAFEFAWLRTSRNLVRLLLVLLIGGVPLYAQKAPPEQQRVRARMENAIRELGSHARMTKMSEQQQRDLVEFRVGDKGKHGLQDGERVY
jgi:hypothetical protein